MTFEELIEKLAEWPDGCDGEQFREYQRSILTPYLADREERIRVLEAQVADAAYSHVPVLREKIRTLEATTLAIHDCEAELEKVYPRHDQANDGELWTCSCGKKYSHVCDEAEGCSWTLIDEPA